MWRLVIRLFITNRAFNTKTGISSAVFTVFILTLSIPGNSILWLFLDRPLIIN